MSPRGRSRRCRHNRLDILEDEFEDYERGDDERGDDERSDDEHRGDELS